jgi:hypothetical protein
MQFRRKAVWITILTFSLLSFTGEASPWQVLGEQPLTDVVAGWAIVVQAFMPIAFGCLLADRLPRDRRLKTGELLDTLPAPHGGRLLGKYLGSTLATLVPISVVYAAGIAYVVIAGGRPDAVPLALLAFAAVNVPGLLFVAAFSVACPAVLWVPLYQFLFVGYWFWGNLLPPYADIPTLTGTPLTPIGEYAAVGFFGPEAGIWIEDATVWEGLASIGLLLSLAALALYVAHRYLRWREARR